LLTAFNVTRSWLLYTANDYAWDTYAPLPKPTGPVESFDAKASAWRTTEKFLTYKPVDTAVKFASIYLWTGSLPAMVVLGTASSVANTIMGPVAVGAGSDFLSPIGHQCNTLVLGPGGYRFGDDWRVGLRLSSIGWSSACR
jgi:hypothetical protein